MGLSTNYFFIILFIKYLFRLRAIAIQANARILRRDGRSRVGALRRVQGSHSCWSQSRAQAAGQNRQHRRDNEKQWVELAGFKTTRVFNFRSIFRFAIAMLQERLFGHGSKSPQSLPHESDGGRAGPKGGPAHPRFAKFAVDKTLWRISIPHQRHIVREVRHENLEKIFFRL